MGQRIAAIIALLIGLFLGNAISQSQDVMVFEWMHPASSTLSDSGKASLNSPSKSKSRESREENIFASFFSNSTKELTIKPGLRVMVFSPHPDDETLAAGGIMQRVVEKEGEVRVVFMTNGDGYPEGVRLSLNRAPKSSNDFIEYGIRRQDEAIQALSELGIPREKAIFLGFPDTGIDDLWSTYWSRMKPFTSPYTHFDRPRYKGCSSKLTKYAGADLEDAIAGALREFAPDWVIIPDPRDDHPDHATTGVFVLDALRKLNQEGTVSFADTQVLTYLVHYKNYPTSAKWLKNIRKTGIAGTTNGVGLLSRTQWLNLPLRAEELERKQCALAAHQTQQQILGGFFKLYVRPSEIFGRLEPSQVLSIPQEYALQFKRPNS